MIAAMAISAHAATLTPQQQATVDKGKAIIADRMKDPDSLKWRNLAVVGDTLCGEVNGKNGYGGYVGYQRFFATVTTGAADVKPFDTGNSYVDGVTNGVWRNEYDPACAQAPAIAVDQ